MHKDKTKSLTCASQSFVIHACNFLILGGLRAYSNTKQRTQICFLCFFIIFPKCKIVNPIFESVCEGEGDLVCVHVKHKVLLYICSPGKGDYSFYASTLSTKIWCLVKVSNFIFSQLFPLGTFYLLYLLRSSTLFGESWLELRC